VFDARYHQAKAKVITITGTTTTSMIVVEFRRIVRSADAMGPCGSSTPSARLETAKPAALNIARTGQNRIALIATLNRLLLL
jgi:hypothetical protein